jgi:hypothetical protein
MIVRLLISSHATLEEQPSQIMQYKEISCIQFCWDTKFNKLPFFNLSTMSQNGMAIVSHIHISFRIYKIITH